MHLASRLVLWSVSTNRAMVRQYANMLEHQPTSTHHHHPEARLGQVQIKVWHEFVFYLTREFLPALHRVLFGCSCSSAWLNNQLCSGFLNAVPRHTAQSSSRPNGHNFHRTQPSPQSSPDSHLHSVSSLPEQTRSWDWGLGVQTGVVVG